MGSRGKLVDLFAGRRPSSRTAASAASGAHEPGLERLLAAHLEAARGAWPGVELAPAVFLPYLAARVLDGAAASTALPRLCVTDLFLACACAAGDARALAHLEHAFLPAISDYVRRLDPSAPFGDEVRQVMRERLLVRQGGRPPRITAYSGEGPLGGWLRVVAIRTARNLRRSHRPAVPLEGVAARAPAPDPEVAYLRRRCEQELQRALKLTIAGLPADERTVLRLYYLDGLTVQAIGVIYRVHASTITRWIARTRQQVLAETQRLLREHMQLGASELASVMGLVGSQLDLSVCRWLREA
jgi:RNA polymerase sigma-70 factor (ECF subfamily)